MNIVCLFKGHNWRFSYHHGVPLGIGDEDFLKMYDEGKAFEVFECKRCLTQSRIIDGHRVILNRKQMERP